MPSVSLRRSPHRDHLVVCGDDALAVRTVEELTTRYSEYVTVILSSRQAGHGPQMARLPGVRVIERDELSSDAFHDAHVESARALALLRQDDLGNFHAALRAAELNPDIRLVVAIFNTRLGERLRSFFRDCAVLSGSAMSAPSFAAAALGEPAPSHIRLSGRTLYVARSADVDPAQVVCGLAETRGRGEPKLLPSDPAAADLVLAVAGGRSRDPLKRRPNPVRGAVGLARRLLWHKLGAAFGVLLVLLVVGFALLATAARYSMANALYLTMMDLAGAALTSPADHGPEKIAQLILTFDGMAFIPVVTAAIVGARLTGSLRTGPKPVSNHVVVVGLGNVGTRIAGQLHDLGVDVVCVDRNENAFGADMARRLGLPLVIGDTRRESILRAAKIQDSQALLSVTSSDVVNLETALHARALREDLRIVLRLSDDDLAERAEKVIGNTISRSVPYLAAPAFALAMLEQRVLRTIPVGRHVLLVVEIRIEAGSELVGRRLRDVHQTGLARAIAVQSKGTPAFDWAPEQDYPLTAQDRLFVLATRAGLRQLLVRSTAPQPLAAGPSVAPSPADEL
ncbi:MAG TPA: NAD-binding protein [Streptosporangiaceae bacterium]|nr:NAD-binding protein [Streptosporangiaceae bacterium]